MKSAMERREGLWAVTEEQRMPPSNFLVPRAKVKVEGGGSPQGKKGMPSDAGGADAVRMWPQVIRLEDLGDLPPGLVDDARIANKSQSRGIRIFWWLRNRRTRT